MLPTMATASRAERSVSTPWGAAAVVERAELRQHAGAKRFSTVVELLETASGEELVRFAYSTDGVARRGPVTLRGRDLDRLRAVLGDRPRLAELLAKAGA
jgi:hypothetical protein